MFGFLPEAASTVAPEVDFLNAVVTGLSVFFTIIICATMLYFAWKYRKRNGVDHQTPRIEGSHTLEVIWTVIPTAVCIYLAWAGVVVYQDMRRVPDNALTVNVQGQKWIWNFQYENGRKTGGLGAELVVPVNQPVKLVMTSTDVLHSFFVPAMRVKQDVVPGKYSYLTFTPVKTGSYDIFCAEYCGTKHSMMLAKVKVVPVDEFNQWVNSDPDAGLPPAEIGKQLFSAKGCNACHGLADGQRIVGPSFYKLFGKKGKFSDGSEYSADENYIHESILYPNKHIVEGYPTGVMPAFEGQLDDGQIAALIAFIKSQDGSVAQPPKIQIPDDGAKVNTASLSPAERGKLIYQNKACIGCHSIDGSKLVGPSFKGAYGKEEELQDGSKVSVNDDYIKESILKPMAKIVKGYAPAMPSYEGQLKDEDIADVIAYLKSIK